MVPGWLKRHIDDFVLQYCKDPPVTIAVRDIAALRLAFLAQQGARLETMPGLPLADGFVWHPAPGRGLPQLWLAPSYGSYRATFEAFARRHLGAAGLHEAVVQIDHVFPKRAAALGGLGYVRMLAVPPESNMAAGRTLEKAMVARNQAWGPRARHTRNATPFSIGKAVGFRGYEALPGGTAAANAALVARLMAHLAAWGLPGDVLGPLAARLSADTAAKQR